MAYVVPQRNPREGRNPGLGDAATDLVSSDGVKMASGIALTYHGYRRTGSIVWALIYGLAGKKLPAVAVPVALAQGFGQKKTCP